jgi:putative SOS response-associated peptidase YedK
MCGRFTLTASPRILRESFPLFDEAELAPSFNIAPTQPVLAVRQLPHAARPEFVRLRWGLIPPWAEDPKVGYRMINARAETAASKPAFREPFRHSRCLIVADGFYEWKKTGAAKQPYYIRLNDGKPFAFAGLYAHWNKGEIPIDSCTILTTAANELMRPLHDRMPVILDPAGFEKWLDPTQDKPDEVQSLLRPFPSAAMIAIPVGTYVNNARNQGPACIAPSEIQELPFA